VTISDWLKTLFCKLNPTSETASLDAQVLLAHVTGKPRSWILAHPEADLSPDEVHTLENALKRLEAGAPLPYVLGHWEFYGLDFIVTPATLIPRPETELLVVEALRWLRSQPGRHWALEVGTGSGCISIALAVNAPGLSILASDISLPALQIARQNARWHGVAQRLLWVQTDLIPPTHRHFDMICANLPYIPTEQLELLPVAQREPRQALDGGPDGLLAIHRLLQAAPRHLAPGGLLILEIEASQGKAARELARASFPGAEVQVLADLAGWDRLLRVELPPA
jgi:release factor glutamine methyltransferase